MAYSKIEIRERLAFVKYWANYVKRTPNSIWSKEQNMLINSVLKTASRDVGLYLKVKRAVNAKIKS